MEQSPPLPCDAAIREGKALPPRYRHCKRPGSIVVITMQGTFHCCHEHSNYVAYSRKGQRLFQADGSVRVVVVPHR